jgi:hypothetical protein
VSANQKIFLVLVCNGDKGWRATGGAVVEMGKDEVSDLQEEAYMWWVLGLAPLKDKTFTLAALPDATVNDRPAVGLKVSSKGHEDIKVYFDRDSGLLVKAERKGKEVGLPVDKAYVFSDHKNFEGVQLPTKYVEFTNGKKFVEVSSITYQFPSKIEEGTFTKP